MSTKFLTMATMYLVSTGSYSDYSILAVFDNEEQAQIYKDAVDDSDIEEYELNPSLDDIIIGRGLYSITMDEHGNVTDTRVTKKNSRATDYSSFQRSKRTVPDTENMIASGRAVFVTQTVFRGGVLAYSEEEAIKIASEKRRQLIALNVDYLPKDESI